MKASVVLLVFSANLPTSALAALQAPKPYLAMPTDFYPAGALAAKVQGTLEVTVVGDANGAIKECNARGNESLAPLKEASCAILTPRIHFGAKNSARRILTIAVEWRIPNGVPESTFGGAIPISPRYWIWADDYPASELGNGGGTTRVRFAIGTNGIASGCEVDGSSGSLALDKRTCEVLLARGRFLPAIDADGNPRATTGKWTLIWRG